MTIKRIVIAGSRNFTDYEQAKNYIDFCISNIRKENEIIIISGGARGADLLGERYAKENGFKIERYFADWENYGRSAGVRRNKTMVEVSDYVICFWEGIIWRESNPLRFGSPPFIILLALVFERRKPFGKLVPRLLKKCGGTNFAELKTSKIFVPSKPKNADILAYFKF